MSQAGAREGHGAGGTERHRMRAPAQVNLYVLPENLSGAHPPRDLSRVSDPVHLTGGFGVGMWRPSLSDHVEGQADQKISIDEVNLTGWI